ncbi:outer membrane protein assembly factor BamB [Pseudoxanthomonas sp. z9]|uniref:outer membrane protein assembly factor BamB n=1 Tax=Pseudoxanthomonas sp. z9 TaxID=2584942 RepID=UPI001141D3E3|nr:outer membrane protein assembly factor BamB [Pseudoxanthomonas sp. z9]MCL6711105.1 outer membrane protein assembly factor BamB [Pseudomonas sp. R2.Fl]
MMARNATGKRLLAMAALVLVLSGCSTIKGWFGGNKKDEKPTEPAELVEFTPSVEVAKLWSANVGKGEDRLGLQQGPVVADGRVYAAAVEGGVRALDLQTGKEVWHFKPEKTRAGDAAQPDQVAEEPASGEEETKAAKRARKEAAKLAKKAAKRKIEWRFSGGPGAGDGLVVIGTLDGRVIALDANDGTEKWRAKVPNEVITAPAVGQGYVLVRTNDGRVTAFDAASGERRWFWTSELPSLTVRGNAPVTLGPGVVFVGNDDGTVAALSLRDGRQVWSQTVGSADGRSELDRMADVDGPPVLDGTTLFATSYKKETVAIEGPSGRPLWQRDNGGPGGLGVTSSYVVVADQGGTVWGLDRYSGNATWSNPKMLRRSLTAPSIHGDYAVVGDFDGYVHWLKLDNGEEAARARAGGKAIRAKPVVADGILLIQNVEGELTAFRFK